MGLGLKLGKLDNDFEFVLAVHLGKNAIVVLLAHTGVSYSIFSLKSLDFSYESLIQPPRHIQTAGMLA